MPRLNAKLYFVDVDGKEYRVHDTQYAGGKHIRVLLGDPSAKYRVFVAKGEEMRRSYEFRKGEDHRITEPDLERQFREAQYSPIKPPPPGITDPR